MAESASSSGEESSEGEKSVSPSLHGPPNPITAANRQTSGEKQALFSERGYLNSLSRQERRRIEREIRKGRKLGEISSSLNYCSLVYSLLILIVALGNCVIMGYSKSDFSEF
jgi:hypothetical protein